MTDKNVSRVNYISTSGSCLNPRTIDRDFREYHFASEQIHHESLHGFGVATGLEVSGTVGNSGVTVQAGVAVDRSGQLVALSENGLAEIGTPGVGSNPVAVPCELDTVPFAGKTAYLTIEFHESKRTDDPQNAPCGVWVHTPWVRLQDPADGFFVDSPKLIYLAIVELDGDGKVVSVQDARTGFDFSRQLVRLNSGGVEFFRAAVTSTGKVAQSSAGSLQPREGGGLEVTVAGSDGEVHFLGAGGDPFAEFHVDAQTATFREKVTLTTTGPGGGFVGTQTGNGGKAVEISTMGSGNSEAGHLAVFNALGSAAAKLTSSSNNGGVLELNNSVDNRSVVLTTNAVDNKSGFIGVHNAGGSEVIQSTANVLGGGELLLRSAADKNAVQLGTIGTAGNETGWAGVFNQDGDVAAILSAQQDVTAPTQREHGHLLTHSGAGGKLVELTTTPHSGGLAGAVSVYNSAAQRVVDLSVPENLGAGEVSTRSNGGDLQVSMASNGDGRGAVRVFGAGEKQAASIYAGKSDSSGYVQTWASTGTRLVNLSTLSGSPDRGWFGIYNSFDAPVVRGYSSSDDNGYVNTNHKDGQRLVQLGVSTGQGGWIGVYDKNDKAIVTTYAGTDNSGYLQTRTTEGKTLINLSTPSSSSNRGWFGVYNSLAEPVVRGYSGSDDIGYFHTSHKNGQKLIQLGVSTGQGGWLGIFDKNDKAVVTTYSGSDHSGYLQTRTGAGKTLINLSTPSGSSNRGWFGVYNSQGDSVVRAYAGSDDFGGLSINQKGGKRLVQLGVSSAKGGWLGVFDKNDKSVVTAYAGNGNSGYLNTRTGAGKTLISLSTLANNDNRAWFGINNADGNTVARAYSGTDDCGHISTDNKAGKTTCYLGPNRGSRGQMILSNSEGNRGVNAFVHSNEAGYIQTRTKEDKLLVHIGTTADDGGLAGTISLYNNAGERKIFLNGKTGQKSFVTPHPKQPGKEIVYAALEGPEGAAYLRGEAELKNGKAKVEYAEHFALVVDPATVTIQVTPGSADSNGLAVVKKTATGFEVRELARGTGSYSFSFFAVGVRLDQKDFQVIADAEASPFQAEETPAADALLTTEADLSVGSPAGEPAPSVAHPAAMNSVEPSSVAGAEESTPAAVAAGAEPANELASDSEGNPRPAELHPGRPAGSPAIGRPANEPR